MTLRISVIVPFRDALHELPGLANALAAQTIAPDAFEVIWVDDASRDGGTCWLRDRLRPTWRLIVLERPRGSYAARNAALQAATSDNLAFTDVDCRPERDWLEEGLAALATAPRVAGRIDLELSPSPSAAELVDARRFLRQRHYVREGFAATANLFVQRAVFRQAGVFDEHLRSGGDQEFGWRCAKAGIPIRYAEDAVVTHAARASLGGLLRKAERVGFGMGQILRSGAIPLGVAARRAAERFTVARGGRPAERVVPAAGLGRRWLLAAVHLLLVLATAGGGLRGIVSGAGTERDESPDCRKKRPA
jgi:glycosyltransferase involved in cell wall biosynthesis